MDEAKRALVQYTIEAEYLKSMQDFQRVRIAKLQELKNEVSDHPGSAISRHYANPSEIGSRSTDRNIMPC